MLVVFILLLSENYNIVAAQSFGSGSGSSPIFSSARFFCYSGLNVINTPNNHSVPTLTICPYINSTCSRFDFTGVDFNEQANFNVYGCNNADANTTCESSRLNFTSCKQTVCNTSMCNKPQRPAHCKAPTNEIQILPLCTVKNNLTQALECGTPAATGYPYKDREKCRTNFQQTLDCGKKFLNECINSKCPMFLDDIPYIGNSVRYSLAAAMETFNFSQVNNATLDAICLIERNETLKSALLVALNYFTFTDIPFDGCDNKTVRDLYYWSLQMLNTILVNGSSHQIMCKAVQHLLDQSRELLQTRCDKTKFPNLIIQILESSFVTNIYESYRSKITHTINYIYDWFLKFTIPSCAVPAVDRFHRFQFMQSVKLGVGIPDLTMKLISAFSFSLTSVKNVTIINNQSGKLKYLVVTDDISGVDYNTLMESYQQYSIHNETSYFTSLPIPGPCSEANINGFTFNSTGVGSTAFSNQICPKGFSQASVMCKATLQDQTGMGKIFVPQFDESTLANVTCNNPFNKNPTLTSTVEVSSTLNNLQLFTSSPQSLNSTDIQLTLTILDSVSQALTQPNIQVTATTLSDIVHITDSVAISIQTTSTGAVATPSGGTSTYKAVQTINEASKKVNLTALGQSSLVIKTKQITLQVSDISLNKSSEINFSPPVVSSSTGEIVQPINISVPLQLSSNGNTKLRTVFVVYENDTLFSQTGAAEWVVSAILGKGVETKQLKNPVKIEHGNEATKHGEKESHDDNKLKVDVVKQQCVFWDPQRLVWSSIGCRLDTRVDPPLCKCDHLTSFALLVSRVEVQADVALLIVSKVGCAISICAIAITIILYLLHRELRKKEHVQIQIHINVNLLIAYIVFLVGISLVDKGVACTGVAAIIQYFFLSAWLWIAVYSNKLYTSIVKVFSIGTTHFVWKACVIGYLLPLVIVAVNLGVTIGYLDKINLNYDYEPPQLDPQSSSYRRDSMCWIHNYSLYIGFLLIVGAILLNNIVVMILVVRHVNKMENAVQSTAQSKDCFQQVKMVFTMSITFGVTWVLGFFMLLSDDETYLLAFSWLFTIFNAFLGILIFYTGAILRKEIFLMWSKPFRNLTNKSTTSSGDVWMTKDGRPSNTRQSESDTRL